MPRERTTNDWPVIDAHRVEVTRAYSADELGTTYALRPWEHNTSAYEGFSEPVRMRLHPDARISRNVLGEKLVYMPDSAYGITLAEAVRSYLAVED